MVGNRGALKVGEQYLSMTAKGIFYGVRREKDHLRFECWLLGGAGLYIIGMDTFMNQFKALKNRFRIDQDKLHLAGQIIKDGGGRRIVVGIEER